jgi:hypothetical protein
VDEQGAGEGKAAEGDCDGDVVVVESKAKTRSNARAVAQTVARTSGKRRRSSKSASEESEVSEDLKESSASEAEDNDKDEDFEPGNSKDNKKAAGRKGAKQAPKRTKIPRKKPAGGDGSSQAGGTGAEGPAKKKRKNKAAIEPKAQGLTIYLKLQGAKEYTKAQVSTVCQLPCFAHPTRCLTFLPCQW